MISGFLAVREGTSRDTGLVSLVAIIHPLENSEKVAPGDTRATFRKIEGVPLFSSASGCLEGFAGFADITLRARFSFRAKKSEVANSASRAFGYRANIAKAECLASSARSPLRRLPSLPTLPLCHLFSFLKNGVPAAITDCHS